MSGGFTGLAGLGGFLSVVLIAVLIGDRWVRMAASGIDPWLRVVTSFVAGFLALGLLGHMLTALSVPWSSWSLAIASLALLAPLWRRSASATLAGSERRTSFHRSAALLAFLPVVTFAWSCVSLRSPFVDFVYHWGPKAKGFMLAEGIDYSFLAAVERRYMHADYPQLFPELVAFSGIFGGGFAERVLLLWTAVFVALLVAVSWQALASCEDPWLAHIGGFVVSLSVCAFAIGHHLGGSPDPGIALGALLGGVLLQRLRILEVAGALGIVAAFTTLLKFEGAMVGAMLVALGLLQGWRLWRRNPGRLAILVGPPIVAALAWLLPIARHDLWRASHRGAPAFDDIAMILETLLRASLFESWRGLPLILLLVPALFLSQKTRWLGALALLMLTFDAYVFLASPVDVEWLILASFPRLALHVLPLVLVGLFLLLDRVATRNRHERMAKVPEAAS